MRFLIPALLSSLPPPFPIKELGDQLNGRCSDFEAVPGHGLKCKVSGVEGYAAGVSERETQNFSRYPCVTLARPLVGITGHPREYQVSCFQTFPVSYSTTRLTTVFMLIER